MRMNPTTHRLCTHTHTHAEAHTVGTEAREARRSRVSCLFCVHVLAFRWSRCVCVCVLGLTRQRAPRHRCKSCLAAADREGGSVARWSARRRSPFLLLLFSLALIPLSGMRCEGGEEGRSGSTAAYSVASLLGFFLWWRRVVGQAGSGSSSDRRDVVLCARVPSSRCRCHRR